MISALESDLLLDVVGRLGQSPHIRKAVRAQSSLYRLGELDERLLITDPPPV